MPRESPLEQGLADALAQRLRELRRTSGMTQEQVANVAQVNRNHYQLLESALSDRAKRTPANPRLSTLVALAEVYGTTVPQLVAEIFDAAPHQDGVATPPS